MIETFFTLLLIAYTPSSTPQYFEISDLTLEQCLETRSYVETTYPNLLVDCYEQEIEKTY